MNFVKFDRFSDFLPETHNDQKRKNIYKSNLC